MAAPLRVNPDSLHTAASWQTEVADHLTANSAGHAMTDAAGAVAGLATAAACDHATTVLDRVTAALAADLTTHAERLTAAADLYVRTDEDIARCLPCR
ncbi:type VII secretion target [Mycobacterium sp. 852013-51886_SCH5428379]|uniref:type VII secretion target n=1 Tax=Mycobacterium sp. 852013-51886_SCH5428379 TaxID=1834111 RepID=UPI0018D2FC21|nr:type VII secretion target [Mycobacterium sp. 852013-51886_SCH5428379]